MNLCDYLHDSRRRSPQATAVVDPSGSAVSYAELDDDAAGVRIIAFLTPQPGERPSIIEMKPFCGKVLPAYMNPDVFVDVDKLPRTSTDKVDYQSLLRLHQGAA